MRVFWIIFLWLISFNSLSKNASKPDYLPTQIKINNIIFTKQEIKNHYNFLVKTRKYWEKILR